jgi:transposase InsO family protein
MRHEQLRAIAPKTFKPKTTDSEHDQPISPNLLSAAVNQPLEKGEVIFGDTTYLFLKGSSFCYLATFQDKYTRRIVGWAVSSRMTAQLVIDALGQALRRRLIKHGAVIHTDRGSQYAVRNYRRL